jgi:L-fuconolactonase
MIIDAHQHFWDLSRADYDWLTPDQSILYCDYLPADLAPTLLGEGVRATVLVQAAPSEAETRYLFRLAQAYPFIAGIVGWVDFQSAGAHRRISALIADGRGTLKGLRPMIQDIPDPHWLSRPALDEAFEAMATHGLVFDALVRPAQIDGLRTCVPYWITPASLISRTADLMRGRRISSGSHAIPRRIASFQAS